MAFSSHHASPNASFASMNSHNASAMDEPNSPSSSNQEASFTVSPDSSMQANGDEQRPRSEERERHPKGRRKRTTAKDRAILEDAYIKNSKPDKNARLDIVNRVSLNEKEVQIWFQNRRQNDRRRSRPLSDQDLAAYRNGGIKIVGADGNATIPFAQHCEPADHETARSPARTASTTPTRSPDLGPWLPGKYHRFTMEVPVPVAARTPATSRATPADASCQSASSRSQSQSFSFSQSGSFLANQRWSTGASFSTPSSLTRHTDGGDDSFRADPFAPSSCSSAASAPILPLPRAHSRSDSRSNSSMRLSMSLDGKATLVSPSPERASTTYTYDPRIEPIPISIPSLRRSSLHHSQSVTLPPISVLTGSLNGPGAPDGSVNPAHAAPLPPRLTRGRSRDVHAWEFAADNGSDRDDELTQQAKDEASGSATAAISLLRTTSASAGPVRASSPVLQPNGSKRNASARHPLGTSGAMQPFKRARLGRTQSSVARLQSSASQLNVSRLIDQAEATQDGDDSAAVKKMDVSAILSINGNESDKENWSPEGKDTTTTAPTAADRILPPVTFPSLWTSRKPLPGGGSSSVRRSGFMLDGRRSPLSSARAYTAPGGVRAARRGHKAGSSIEIFEDHEDDLRGEEEEMVTTEGRRAGGGGRRDDEIARFMSGEVSPSKKPDLDCITGLLSLSKGNWR